MTYIYSFIPFGNKNLTKLKKILNLCEVLNINNIILVNTNNKLIERERIEEIKVLTDINIYFRHHLMINNINKLNNTLNRFSQINQIISIESFNPKVLLKAAKDSRIDLVSFLNMKQMRLLNKGIISLIKQNNSFIEISLSSVFNEKEFIQSKELRILYKILKLVLDQKLQLIISYPPRNVYDIRHPRNLIAICQSILEIPISYCKSAFMENIISLLNHVENRINEKIFEIDVSLVKGDFN